MKKIKYKVLNYNFTTKKWEVMKLVNEWKGRKTAVNLTKDQAEFIKWIALYMSGNGIKAKVIKQ